MISSLVELQIQLMGVLLLTGFALSFLTPKHPVRIRDCLRRVIPRRQICTGKPDKQDKEGNDDKEGSCDATVCDLACRLQQHIAPILLVFVGFASASLVSLSLIVSQYNTDNWFSLPQAIRSACLFDALYTIIGYLFICTGGIIYSLSLVIIPQRHQRTRRIFSFTVVGSLTFLLFLFAYVVVELGESLQFISPTEATCGTTG